MENEFLSLLDADTLTKVFGITFFILCFIGIIDFMKNTEKMGE